LLQSVIDSAATGAEASTDTESVSAPCRGCLITPHRRRPTTATCTPSSRRVCCPTRQRATGRWA